jgi:hypothetical protein
VQPSSFWWLVFMAAGIAVHEVRKLWSTRHGGRVPEQPAQPVTRQCIVAPAAMDVDELDGFHGPVTS